MFQRISWIIIALLVGMGHPSSLSKHHTNGSALAADASILHGCSASSASFAAAPDRSFDESDGLITSTLVVSGLSPLLWEVQVTTAISHTRNSDIDMTLTSPAGTVVTLTTDNGRNNADGFSNTRWSDRASPGGALPYTSTPGLVTDHSFSDQPLADALVPEEPLAAFHGENPNGIWTLSIVDDLDGSSGVFNRWGLTITAMPALPASTTTYFISTPGLEISASGTALLSSTLDVHLGGFITGLSMTTAISHTWSEDLDITLTSPAGSIVTLTTDNGGVYPNAFAHTTWRVDASPGGELPYSASAGLVTDHPYASSPALELTPEESFGLLYGEMAAGIWTLTISDDSPFDGGMLNSWSLAITTGSCQPPASSPTATLVMPTATLVVPTATPTPTVTPVVPTATPSGSPDYLYLPLVGR